MLSFDSRVELIQLRYSKGRITCIDDILPVLPKTTLAKHLGVDFKRFDRLLERAEMVTMKEMMKMSRVFEWKLDQVVNLWKAQYDLQQSRKNIPTLKK